MNRYNSNAFRNGIPNAENAFRFDGNRLGRGAFYGRESKSRSRLHSSCIDCTNLTRLRRCSGGRTPGSLALMVASPPSRPRLPALKAIARDIDPNKLSCAHWPSKTLIERSPAPETAFPSGGTKCPQNLAGQCAPLSLSPAILPVLAKASKCPAQTATNRYRA